MRPGDISLICHFGGKLIDGDRNAKYIGGSNKGDSVPNNIGYASFKEKIQEIVKIPLNGTEFKIKCGVRFDEFTVIGMDVDDDQSLRFVMDRSKFIMVYVLEHLPTTTTYTVIQRDEDVLPSGAATTNTALRREDLVLPTAGVQFQEENPIDGASNHKSVEMDTIELNPPGNDGMNTNRGVSPSESKFIEWFPKELLPFITGYENPEGDGNCGFRALCMALGKDEREWVWMRDRLVKEIESNNEFYKLLFGLDETIKLVERIWHFEGWAPCTKWMDMPSTGFVFAQAFKVVLVHYSKENCWTFVPWLTLPKADNATVKILGIGLVENNHYIKLDFQKDCPLPPFPHVPSNWRTMCPREVNSWEELLAPRLRACKMMNVPGLQFNKCIGETVIIDGEDSVLQEAAFIDGTHIDISGADMNSLEYMHHRYSQPNADHYDGGIDFTIRAHEHQEDNEVNVAENAVYEENQVTSQMEQNVPPLDVDIGREFPDIDALRNALSDMAVTTGREYKHVRTSPSKLKMKCKAEDCKWSIQATRLSSSPAFKVVKYQEVHTCKVHTNSGDEDHPQATVKWILSKMQINIEKDPYMEPTKIVKEMKDRYKIKISYNKAVKAKTKALEVMRQDLNPVPDVDMCRALKVELERGSATICKSGVTFDGGTFQHFFWSFQACIDALRNHLRPVVYVGRVDTKIGVLIYACGVDGNNIFCSWSDDTFIEVGFGFYYDSTVDEILMWETFLVWLKECVLPPPTAAAGIPPFTIVTKFEETAGLTRAVENVLPHLHHFFNSFDFASVFSKKFEGNNLFTLCIEACRTFSAEKCEAALQEIKSENKEAYSWLMSVGSRSHWAIAFSPNKHALAVLSWGVEEDFYWNLESPSIVEMVEGSREMVANYFSERRMEGEEAATRTPGLPPGVMEDIQRAKRTLVNSEVQSIGGCKYQVSRESCLYPYQEVVDLEEKSCTCGEFQAIDYPCHHALGVIAHLDLDVRTYMSRRWYSLDTYLATYAGILPPPVSDHILHPVPPKRGRVGRPPKRAAKKINFVG